MHIDKNLTKSAVLVFAGSEVDLVVPYSCLLCVAGPAIGKTPSLSQVAIDNLFSNTDGFGFGGRFSGVGVYRDIGEVRGVGYGIKGLAQL